MSYSCGFVGCGLASFERAKTFEEQEVKCCLDDFFKVEKEFCQAYKFCEPMSYDKMLDNTDVVFVCTPHEFLYDYASSALQAGKHVLVEKPGAVTSEQLRHLEQLAKKNNLVCHIGYTIGNIMLDRKLLHTLPNSILANYCHGARPTYAEEWRMRSSKVGGGVSYDLLSHIIHMSLLCNSNLELISGSKFQTYWKNCEGDDVAIAVLGDDDKTAVLYASCADWKKNFSFSANYNDYKIEIKNVNARNGDFEYTLHSTTGPGIIPQTKEIKDNGDFWIQDTLLFINKIKTNQPTDLSNEIKVLEILENIK